MSATRLAVACLVCLLPALACAELPRVESFSPQGTAKSVRQATARFSAPMVPFGEPRLADPFDVNCPVKGSGRWIDDRNWAYDFGRELPAGLRCTFALKSGLTDVAGQALEAASHAFSTGGPAVIGSVPYAGARSIDEAQAFVLALDAPATEASVAEYAWCDVAGIGERIAVQRVPAPDRVTVMEANRGLVEAHLRRYYRPGGRAYRKRDFAAALNATALPIAVVQCQRRLPNDAQVRLVWGRGIAAASGIATVRDQTLAFQTRPGLPCPAQLHARSQAGAVHPGAADRAHVQRTGRTCRSRENGVARRRRQDLRRDGRSGRELRAAHHFRRSVSREVGLQTRAAARAARRCGPHPSECRELSADGEDGRESAAREIRGALRHRGSERRRGAARDGAQHRDSERRGGAGHRRACAAGRCRRAGCRRGLVAPAQYARAQRVAL